MSWLPRFSIVDTCAFQIDGEYEGRTLQVIWLGFVFELTFAKWEDHDAR